MIDDAKIQVVAVCGRIATIYGKQHGSRPRRKITSRTFSNYGQAKEWADEYEDAERARLRKYGGES